MKICVKEGINPHLTFGHVRQAENGRQTLQTVFFLASARSAKWKALLPFALVWFFMRVIFMLTYFAADSYLLYHEENYIRKPFQLNDTGCIQIHQKRLGAMGEFPGFICVPCCFSYSVNGSLSIS